MENGRRAVQVLSFAAFLYLFLLTIGRYDAGLRRIALPSAAPIDTFFRIDPLLGLTTMVAIRRVIEVMLLYALPVVVLTVLAGRFFCGWICPLGTTLDAADVVFFRKRKSRPSRAGAGSPVGAAGSFVGAGFEIPPQQEVPLPARDGARRVKYYILLAVLGAALFSAQLAYLLDPITIITRALTFAVFPLVQLGAWWLSDAGIRLESGYLPQDVQYFFRLNFLAAVVLVSIVASNAISRRYWCRNLCPLGALLAVISRFSVVRRLVADNCANCRKCVPDCKMGAIDPDPKHYQAPECIYCYSCTRVCPALSTRIIPSLSSEGYHSSVDLNRRRTLQALGVGAFVAVLGKTNAAAKTSRVGKVKVSSELLIRPPGALPEEEFVDRCVRCSECMKVCPTNGLQPALAEAGFRGLWSPVLVPRIGECAQNCNLCSQVCSSQAIQPFTIPEKSHLFIGRAVIDRSQCIAWNSDKQCLVCDEACSYHALRWKKVEGVRRPFVDDHKCVGCGICENVCPIQPMAAVRVFSFGDQRHKTREEQKRFFRLSETQEQPPERPQ